jgi:hypothetical protein
VEIFWEKNAYGRNETFNLKRRKMSLYIFKTKKYINVLGKTVPLPSACARTALYKLKMSK